MLYYIKKYPFSLVVLLLVVYLSFFKPGSIRLPWFFYFDKVSHFCMYGGVSGVLWLEYLWNHRKEKISAKRGLIGASLCPVLFSGAIELLQEYMTSYRGGEWLDLLANSLGVLVATLISWYLIRPIIQKRFSK